MRFWFFWFVSIWFYVSEVFASAIDDINGKSPHEILFRAHLRKVAELNLKDRFNPSVFISYSWDSEAYKRRIHTLCEDLEKAGIPANQILFDQWANRPGGAYDLHQFMERIPNSDKVLLFGSPELKRKYEEREAYPEDAGIISHEINLLRNRIVARGVDGLIPAWFEGQFEDSFPISLHHIIGRQLDNYFIKFFELLEDIYQITHRQNPIMEIRNNFVIRRDKLQTSFQATQFYSTNDYVPQSLISRAAFLDRTNDRGLSYLDVIFEELFMNEDETKHFSTLTLCTLSGLGGVGKTTLVTEFAYKYRRFYQFVCWLDASTKRDFLTSCVKLLESFGVLVPEQQIEGEEEPYFSDVIRMMNEFLPKHKQNWLLIVDNIEEPEFVADFAPAGGHILYTSRNGEWDKKLEIDVFKPEESVEFLLQIAGFDASHKDAALALAVELDHLPLALAQAAAYVKRQRLSSFAEYLTQYKEKYAYLLAQKQIESSLNKRTAIVMTTWHTTMQKLAQESRQLMTYCSYLSPTAIPVELFYDDKREHVRDAIDELEIYSMINCNGDYFSVHRLVQLASRPNIPTQNTAVLETLAYKFFKFWEKSDHILANESDAADFHKLHRNLSLLLTHSEKVGSHLKVLMIDTDRLIEESVYASHMNFKIFKKQTSDLLRNVTLRLFDIEENGEDNVVLHNVIKKYLSLDDADFAILMNQQKKIFRNKKAATDLFHAFEILTPIEPQRREYLIDWFEPFVPHDMRIKGLFFLLEKLIDVNITENIPLKEKIEQELNGNVSSDNWSSLLFLPEFNESLEDNKPHDFRHVRYIGENIDAEQILTLEWRNAIIRARCLFTELMSINGCIDLIKETLDVRPEEWAEVCKKLVPLVKDKMNGYERISLIKIASRMGAELWNTAVSRALHFITDQMNGYECISLIKAASKLSDEQWAMVVKRLTPPFITKEMSANEYTELINTALEMDEQQWGIATERTVHFITKNMDGFYRSDFLKFASKMDKGKWDISINRITPFIRDNNDLYDIKDLIRNESVLEMGEEEWGTAVNRTVSLMTEEMGVSDRINLILELFRMDISEAEWEAGDRRASSFITEEKVDGLARIYLIEVASKMNNDAWNSCIRRAKIIVPGGILEYGRKHNIDKYGYIHSLIRKISELGMSDERWDTTVNRAISFMTEEMDINDRIDLIEKLSEIEMNDEEWGDSLLKAKMFMTEMMDESDCLIILETASTMDIETWNEVALLKVKPHLTQTMKGVDCVPLIEAALMMNKEEWDETLLKIRPLTTKTMSGSDYVALIEVASTMSQDVWDDILLKVEPVMTQEMNGADCIALIEAALTKSQEEWGDILLKIRLIITKTMNGPDFAALIEVASMMFKEEWNVSCLKAQSLITDAMSGLSRAKLIRIASTMSDEEWNNTVFKIKPLSKIEGLPLDYVALIELGILHMSDEEFHDAIFSLIPSVCSWEYLDEIEKILQVV